MLELICILMIGDSISARPESFAHMTYDGAQIANVAAGGTTIRHWSDFSYLDARLATADCDADVAHVMLGGNDANAIYAIEQAEWRFRLQMLRNGLTARLPGVEIWVSHTTRLYGVADQADVDRRLASYDAVIDEFVGDGRVELGIDARDLGLTAEDFGDGVHPTVEGHLVLADAFDDRIVEAVPEPDMGASLAIGSGVVAAMRRRRR